MADTFKDDAPSCEEWMALLTSVRIAAGVVDLSREQLAEAKSVLDGEVEDVLLTNADYLEDMAMLLRGAGAAIMAAQR